MKRVGLVLIASIALTGFSRAEPLQLARGVGVHDWLNWAPVTADGTYRWPPYRDQEEWLAGARPLSDWPPGDQFERIHAMGFDFVRLTVDPGPLLATEGAFREEALSILASAVRTVTASGLKVVFNLHGVSQIPRYGMEMIYGGSGSEGVATYRAMVTDVAAMLVDVGTENVALEPYNEPAYYPCDDSGTGDWQQIMADTVADIRAISTRLTVIATGACGGSITGLTDLDPSFDDPNLLYSFHMYEPHSFTHQRAEDPENFSAGLPWPSSAGNLDLALETLRAHMDAAGVNLARKARNMIMFQATAAQYFLEGWGQTQLEARIGEAVDWAQDNDIAESRLFMGEFGTILMTPDGRMGAFNADRLRYLAAVRQQAETYGFAWSVWEYSNPYGMSVILPIGPAMPDTQMLHSLGLPPAQ